MKEYIVSCINIIKNKKFIHYFILYSSIFIFSFIVSAIIGFKITGLSDGVVFFVTNYTSLRFNDGGMIAILANNFFVSMILVYYFYSSDPDTFKKFLGVFYFSYMGAIAGLLISKVAIMSNLVIALSLIVPHGIIEIPTIIYAVSSGWVLSGLKGKSGSKIPRELIYTFVALFVLLGISAYIECNITLDIYKMALSYYR